MKKQILLTALIFGAGYASLAQNTFPANGNVGIGTNSPTHKLEVKGDAQIESTVITSSNSPFPNSTVLFSQKGFQNMFGVDGQFTTKYFGMKTDGNFTIMGGNVGIGTTNPTAKITFNDVNGSTEPSGISWYGPAPLNYGIYRTAGDWVAPYQQLKLQWDTGIILDPGTLHGKSFVDIGGGGLRVSSGNVGIGTTTPENNDGWTKVMEVHGYTDAKSILTSNNINTGSWVHENGFFGAPAGGMVGTSTNHPFSIIAAKAVKMTFLPNGNVGIGTITPKEALSVNGNIRAREVKVETRDWPDYVFEEGYKVGTLGELETYIKANKHLPGIADAKNIEENGISVSETIKAQQKIIEELTLHLIEKEKEIKESNKKINELDLKLDLILKKINNTK
ncbi:hypothetical protein [Pedobacter yonginense]|nr:hypothetical protein [Pedobacter yonginense]